MRPQAGIPVAWARALLASLVAAALAVAPGCGGIAGGVSARVQRMRNLARHGTGGGAFVLSSQLDPALVLKCDFPSACLLDNDGQSATLLLWDGPEESPRQVLILRMLWRPTPGKTPVTPTATNATVQHLVFAGGKNEHLGIYSGAGFIEPAGGSADDTLSIDLVASSLRLSDRTESFSDLFIQASLQGSATATREPGGADDRMRRFHVRVRDLLGFPRLVRAD